MHKVDAKFHHPFHLHLGKHKDFVLNEDAALYLTHTLRFFAVSLVGIFIPVYIYNLAQNNLLFSQTPVINGFSWVLIYMGLRSLGVLLILGLFTNIIFSKLHLQRSIIFSYIVILAEVILWVLAEKNLFFIFPAGILAGLRVAFYWIPYNIFFVRKIKEKSGHFGKSTGTRAFFVMLASGISPFIGGLIVTSFGFNALFISVVLVLICASIPIIFSVTESKHRKHSIKEIVKNYYLNPKYEKLSLAYFGEGMESLVYLVFWPILLFLTLSSFVKLGFLRSVALLLSSITMLLVGRLIDRYGSKLVHGIGISVNAFLYVPRLFSIVPGVLYFVDIVDRVNAAFYAVPSMSTSYEKSKRQGDSDFIIYREIAIHLPILLLSICLILIITAIGVWKWVFVLGIVGSLLAYFLDLDEN